MGVWLAAAPAWAVECGALAWDHDGHPELALFRLYVSSMPGQYRWGTPFIDGGYWATEPSLQRLATQMSCQKIHLPFPPGRYYAVLTAVDAQGQLESAPSNEIQLRLASGKPLSPTPPPSSPPPGPSAPAPVTPPASPAPSSPPPAPSASAGPPPLMPLPPIPSGPTAPNPKAWPVPTPTAGGSGGISSTCQWQGTCP